MQLQTPRPYVRISVLHNSMIIVLGSQDCLCTRIIVSAEPQVGAYGFVACELDDEFESLCKMDAVERTYGSLLNLYFLKIHREKDLISTPLYRRI
jgi:hypothetical protein